MFHRLSVPSLPRPAKGVAVTLAGRPETATADFESWYREEGPRLVQVLTLALADPEVAKDSADEAFARAYERWPRVSVMQSPTGWTYRVALNHGKRRLLRRQVERTLLLRQTRETSTPPEGTHGRDADLWAIVAGLPRRQRTAIVLRYLGDFSELQVAHLMGISAGAASASLSAARRRLAELIDNDTREPRMPRRVTHG